MPATFESFGIKFLYPDNWSVSERAEDESDEGMTLELPCGGFFSVELEDEGMTDDEVIERVRETLRAEYEEMEVGEIQLDGAGQDERTIELTFYYLDLLIISRIVLIKTGPETLIVQIQAESRDFEKNEPVFAAILQQIRE